LVLIEYIDSAAQGQREPGPSPALHGRTATANRSTQNSEMSSSTAKSSTRSKSCVCWRNAGAFTTTRSDRTPRWVTGHRLRKRATNNKGHGEVETATRFPLLHTPDGGYLNPEIAALH